MTTENVLVVRRNRFDSPRNALTRSAPPSMMVMQQLVGAMTRMNGKIDALALRQAQLPEVRYPRPIQVEAKPVDRRQNTPSLPQPRTERTKYRVIRSTLLDLFE